MTCPVCGYDELTAPLQWSICPSCGTEFGYSDRHRSYDHLRAQWISTGAPWDSTVVPPPPHWSPVRQLGNIGYAVTAADRAALAQRQDIAIG